MSGSLRTSNVGAWATRRDWDLDDVLPESLVTPVGAGPVASAEHEPRVGADALDVVVEFEFAVRISSQHFLVEQLANEVVEQRLVEEVG